MKNAQPTQKSIRPVMQLKREKGMRIMPITINMIPVAMIFNLILSSRQYIPHLQKTAHRSRNVDGKVVRSK